ncbi:hypothetical protein HanPI659440_Chr13g0494751 [Helianthus annuus]|nr:hypothetical protein HanPI659440_Chr13g0494751 [Helianthus annuus]
MMLRSNRKDYKSMTLGDFIKHLEAQEMEQRKIARMKNYDGEQDISLYYKSGVTRTTNLSPKVETATVRKILLKRNPRDQVAQDFHHSIQTFLQQRTEENFNAILY